jgi:hypothetical protein
MLKALKILGVFEQSLRQTLAAFKNKNDFAYIKTKRRSGQ